MEWNAREVLQSLRYIINTGKVRENCQFQEKQWVTHGIKLRSCMWSFYYLVYIRVFLLETRFFISVSSCYRENMISASKLLTGCSESLCWFFFSGTELHVLLPWQQVFVSLLLFITRVKLCRQNLMISNLKFKWVIISN